MLSGPGTSEEAVGAGIELQPADRTKKCGQRGDSKNSGGGGNRTPVRKHSAKSYYTLSSRFDLAGSTPVSGILTASLEKV